MSLYSEETLCDLGHVRLRHILRPETSIFVRDDVTRHLRQFGLHLTCNVNVLLNEIHADDSIPVTKQNYVKIIFRNRICPDRL